MKKKKINAVPFVALTISLILSGLLLYQIEVQKLHNVKERTHYVASSQVSKLQYIINSLLLKTQTLEMLVVENGGEVKNFDNICEKLMDNTAIRSLQLAPKGVVTYVYPLKGNEQAFGDLFSDPDRCKEAEYARDSGNMTLAGPYELTQGGLGAVARRPIYLEDDEGNSEFWGFSVIILNIPDAFYPAELDKFAKSGFDYKLHRIDPNTNNVQIISQSSDKILKNPTDISFDVPNGTWTFSVTPATGWISEKELFLEIFICIAISMLVTLLTSTVIRLENQRKKMSDLSMTDNLTGLKNQRILMKTMQDNYENKIPFTLLYMDFDGFKNINDTYGHSAGDVFLIESAGRLSKSYNDNACAYRIGGDEFAIIINKDLSSEESVRELDNLNLIFADPFTIENKTIAVSVSAGAARYPQDAQSIEELIRIADKAMYVVKNARKETL
ncbi:MAG: sensor domain-containing diguanylate cyclase [Oscillospiraceae bacterium]